MLHKLAKVDLNHQSHEKNEFNSLLTFNDRIKHPGTR